MTMQSAWLPWWLLPEVKLCAPGVVSRVATDPDLEAVKYYSAPVGCTFSRYSSELLPHPDSFVLRQAQDGVLRQAQDGVLRQAQDGVLQQAQDGVLRQAQDGVLRQAQDGMALSTSPLPAGEGPPEADEGEAFAVRRPPPRPLRPSTSSGWHGSVYIPSPRGRGDVDRGVSGVTPPKIPRYARNDRSRGQAEK